MTFTTTALESTHQQHHALTVYQVACVILSCVLEPGDSDAGKLVTAIGAVETVSAILDRGNGSAHEQLRARALPRFSIGHIEQAFRAAARFWATLIAPEPPHWPTRITDLGDNAPFALSERRNSEILTDAETAAIVGASAAASYGERITMEIATGFGDRRHTIANLVAGVDRFYPAGRDALPNHIVEAGAVICEVRCGRGPTTYPAQQSAPKVQFKSNLVMGQSFAPSPSWPQLLELKREELRGRICFGHRP